MLWKLNVRPISTIMTLQNSLFLQQQVSKSLKQNAGDLLFLHMLQLVMKLLLFYCLKIIMIDGWTAPRERIGVIPELHPNIQQGVTLLKLPRMETYSFKKGQKSPKC